MIGSQSAGGEVSRSWLDAAIVQVVVDPIVRANRRVWEIASEKHVREDEQLLNQANTGQALTRGEQAILAPLLSSGPSVLHLQSGHGLDDIALVRAGASRVIGLDYSAVAATAAACRARELEVACQYVVAQLPPAPLRTGCADLVYTGKGALIWMPDLRAWAEDVHRLLVDGGHLFIHEAHPLVPLWSWDADRTTVRHDRSYFDSTHVNDTYPSMGAVEWQWTLGDIVTTIANVGLEIVRLVEHPEPFWRPGGVEAAAWDGRLPNSYTLLARRRAGDHGG